MLKNVQAINAEDIPAEYHEECDDLGISLHCATEMHCVEDDDSPFSNWLKSQGFDFDQKSWSWLGVWGT